MGELIVLMWAVCYQPANSKTGGTQDTEWARFKTVKQAQVMALKIRKEIEAMPKTNGLKITLCEPPRIMTCGEWTEPNI